MKCRVPVYMLMLTIVSFPYAVRAESADGGSLFMGCNGRNILRLSYQDLSAKPWPQLSSLKKTFEKVEVKSLIQHGVSENENAVRTGSAITKRTCGPFEVEISGGYFNSNSQGENGGEDSFPVVTISHGETTIVKHMNIGFCKLSDSRFADCPKNWASELRVSLVEKLQLPNADPISGKIVVDVTRLNQEETEILLPN